jgi:hypothetical protein
MGPQFQVAYDHENLHKTCCISSNDVPNTAIEFGANAIGLVAKITCRHGPIPDDLINQIANSFAPLIGIFRLTSETSAIM